ncbi:hypothetical protein SO802_005130 [Lithocarpus litseifolius]|uniref:Uncharacterized protein n=1 Tax=Lithocarpus litseifolius TaxID=425828 RepID=A0AAW2DJS8_9ROSI
MTPLLAISIFIDSVQGVISGLSHNFLQYALSTSSFPIYIFSFKANGFDTEGVARGCGWQQLAIYVNLATFYISGVPIACVLGFKKNLKAKRDEFDSALKKKLKLQVAAKNHIKKSTGVAKEAPITKPKREAECELGVMQLETTIL